MGFRVRTWVVLISSVIVGACGGASPAAPSGSASSSARYRVTFDASWSAATHPTDFPAAAHFSGLVGATHRAAGAFWRNAGLATEGIRSMAERGSKTPLTSEIDRVVASGAAEFTLSGGGIALSPGSVSLDFEISQLAPLVTLVSMVAPSPDWFVGVNGLPLYEGGAWRDLVRIDLYPWDAGTDSGATFLDPDQETAPRQLIAPITGAPFLNGGQVAPLGTFTFRRLQ